MRSSALRLIPLLATAGNLISYGPDPINPFRRAAKYFDRILEGEKANLPAQTPTIMRLQSTSSRRGAWHPRAAFLCGQDRPSIEEDLVCRPRKSQPPAKVGPRRISRPPVPVTLTRAMRVATPLHRCRRRNRAARQAPLGELIQPVLWRQASIHRTMRQIPMRKGQRIGSYWDIIIGGPDSLILALRVFGNGRVV